MFLTVSGMNKKLFNKIYFTTANNNFLKKLAIFVSEFSKPAFIIIYALGIFFNLLNDGNGIAKILAVPFFTLLFNSTIRKLLNKPRPFTNPEIIQLVKHKNSGSFPSNHACSSVIISLSYLAVKPELVPFFLVFSFFTGLSRIATGVHYPVDVLAGWAVSFFSGIIFFKFF